MLELMMEKLNAMSQEVQELRRNFFLKAELTNLKNIVNVVTPLERKVESMQRQLNQSADLLCYLVNQMRETKK